MKKPTAAAIYARISSDRDGAQAGVKRQVADCRDLAERKGWPVAEVYVDDDVSAYSGRVRPAYRRVLDDLTAGTIDAVIVWHLDRLHRQPRELEEFFDACEQAQVNHLATFTGDVDLATHDGQFMARILGAVARKESDDKSRRISRKHLEIAQQGLPSGGPRPYGYDDDHITVRPDEAAIIRQATRRTLAGESLRSIVIDLNNRGVPTSQGNQWTQTTLRRLLLSARIAGLREYKGEVVAEAVWDAIITRQESSALNARLTDPSRRTSRSARRYVLAGGLLRCGRCGANLVSRPRANGTRRYRCVSDPGKGGCGRISIHADPLEKFVTEAVLYRLDSPELAAALTGAGSHTDDDDIHGQIQAAQSQLDELADLYGNGQITAAEWLRARKPIEGRIDRPPEHCPASPKRAL